MNKAIELAHSVGMQHVKEHDRFIVDKADLSKFYTFARADLLAENTKLHEKLDALLAHCPDGECMTCGEIICDHKDPMHFHHDGCPSCTELGENDADQ